jgi:hypothetical protein
MDQLEHVVKMCEEANMKVSGLVSCVLVSLAAVVQLSRSQLIVNSFLYVKCFDAGGNNAACYAIKRN